MNGIVREKVKMLSGLEGKNTVKSKGHLVQNLTNMISSDSSEP